MNKRKISLIIAGLLCVNGCVFASEKSDVRDPFDAGYTGAYTRMLAKKNVASSDKVEKKSSKVRKAENVKKAEIKDKEKTIKVEKKETRVLKKDVKPTSDEVKKGALINGIDLSPVQKAIRENEGRFPKVTGDEDYFLDGEKIEYPDSTRVIRYETGKPVHLYLEGNRITNIYLNRDEYIEDIVIDKKDGLRVEKTYERGRYARWHISLTPIDNIEDTDMYVVTNKRAYYLRLVPSPEGRGYRQIVRYAYPKLENINPDQELKVEKDMKE